MSKKSPQYADATGNTSIIHRFSGQGLFCAWPRLASMSYLVTFRGDRTTIERIGNRNPLADLTNASPRFLQLTLR
jgi:hypothetical protein